MDNIKLIDPGYQESYGMPNGITILEINNERNSEILKEIIESKEYDCFILKTSKGRKFIFRTGKESFKKENNISTPIGIRVNLSNEKKEDMIILDRSIDFETKCEFEDLDNVPSWIEPLKLKNDSSEFIKADMSSGKNEALYKQISRLKKLGYDNKNIEKIADIINNHIFETPIPEFEIDNILAANGGSSKFKKEEKLNHVDIAERINEVFDIKFMAGSLHIYEDGVWKEGKKRIEDKMIEMMPTSTISKRREAMAILESRNRSEEILGQDNICLLNGVYSFKDKKLYPHSPELATRTKLNFSYVDDSKRNKYIDSHLNALAMGDKENELLMLQAAGNCMTNSIREAMMFILYGPTAYNGKSTYIKILIKALGQENISTLSIQDLAKGGFEVPEIDNKVANICDDDNPKFIEDTSTIKSLTSGGIVTVRKIYGEPFQMTPKAKIMLGTNTLPKAPKDEGWYRRIMIINFKNRFEVGDPGYDPDFNEENLLTQNALDWFGTIAINAYQKIYDQSPSKKDKWANYEETKRLLQEYKIENDSALSFISQLDIMDLCSVENRQCIRHPKTNQRLIQKSDMYDLYVDYCRANSFKVKSSNSFGATAKDIYDDLKFNSKRYWGIKD